MLTTNNRIYFPIQSEPHYDIYTGLSASGKQLLMTSWWDNDVHLLVHIYFSEGGNFLSFDEKVIDTRESMLKRDESNDLKHSQQLQEMYDEELTIVKSIMVKRFMIEKYKIGVQNYPDYIQHRLDNQDLDNVDEEFIQNVEEWNESNYFIFWCHNDFWCNEKGLIIAS